MLKRVPNARGLVLGICAGGFGAGSVFVTPIQTALINPDNIKPNNVTQFETYEPSKTLETVEFYVLWVLMLCGTFPMVLIMSLYKIIGQRDIHNDQFLVTVGSLASAANMIGRVMWGELADKIAYRTLITVVFVLWGAMLTGLPFSPHVPHIGMYAFALLVILMFLCVAGLHVLLPYAARKLFGQEYFAANYGLVFTAVVRTYYIRVRVFVRKMRSTDVFNFQLPGAMVGSAISTTASVKHHIIHLCFGCAGVCLVGKYYPFSDWSTWLELINCTRPHLASNISDSQYRLHSLGVVAALQLPSQHQQGPRTIKSLCHRRKPQAETR
ncbi:unnamed protein product [Mesocestoides corti]|uniref:Major facilitator superfamily (MFS) profile domain-containing protein n=1 Tax=Mesocestoides corti TaxID=53468 RepID=A0A0R3UQ37_MESCO|nr:unnamed protein product [Mesocestoides corti]